MNYPPETIEHPVDNLGRKHIEIDGLSFTVIKRKPFREWLGKYYNVNEFDKLNPEEKKVIFLRWKWGLEYKIETYSGKTKYNDESNFSAEYSRKDDLKNIDAIINSAKNNGTKWYWENVKRDEEYCDQIARDIGVMASRFTPQAQKIADQFGGTVKFGVNSNEGE